MTLRTLRDLHLLTLFLKCSFLEYTLQCVRGFCSEVHVEKIKASDL